jgi:hypothetical protein
MHSEMVRRTWLSGMNHGQGLELCSITTPVPARTRAKRAAKSLPLNFSEM